VRNLVRSWYVALLFNSFWVYANPTVLLLNSYHPQYKWTAEITRGVQQEMSKILKTESLHVEFMDQRRFIADSAFFLKLLPLLQYKYQQYPPDIIITSDDAAFNFILNYGAELFPGTPVVFCGVNIFNPDVLMDERNITGIVEGDSIWQNLKLIKSLQPDVKRIVMLGDNKGFGLQLVNKVKGKLLTWQKQLEPEQIQLEIWDDFSLTELNQKASELTRDSAILMLMIHKDKLGHYFSYDEHLPELTKISPVPVYGMWGSLIVGNGALGGYISDPYEHGVNAAKMALQILAGKAIADLPIVPSAVYRPRFDYRQLQRFAIDVENVPANSIIYHQPISFYQHNRQLINSGLIIILFLLGIIFVMLKIIHARNRAQLALKQLNQQLDSLVKQRTLALQQANTELQVASKVMEQLAYSDSLTGLKNRRAANYDIPAYLNRIQQGHSSMVVGLVDIDHFKRVNDTFGHQVGDDVLQELAKILRTSVRPSDLVYRWGGEEFLIALPETELKDAHLVCQRVLENVRQHQMEKVGGVTISLGITEYRSNDDYDSIVKRADEALYLAKQRGRNQMVVN
jgi:diguanylate cyclase (GGDEF)-like protein